jgi:hypothetical protein
MEYSAGKKRSAGGYALLAIHCTENPVYAFPEMKLCGLVLNSYIHVSVSDLYIPRIGLPIWLLYVKVLLCLERPS